MYELGKVYTHKDLGRVTYQGNVSGVLHFKPEGHPVLELIPTHAAEQILEMTLDEDATPKVITTTAKVKS